MWLPCEVVGVDKKKSRANDNDILTLTLDVDVWFAKASTRAFTTVLAKPDFRGGKTDKFFMIAGTPVDTYDELIGTRCYCNIDTTFYEEYGWRVRIEDFKPLKDYKERPPAEVRELELGKLEES